MPLTYLVQSIIDVLRERGETLCVAESLTGGGLASSITALPGASDVFLGGVIAYNTSVKENLLHVSVSLVEEFTVVSEEVAQAMAFGAANATGATWAIVTTGVAGPGPSEGAAAGTVWVAIVGPVHHSTLLQLQGGRDDVRNATISSAISTFSRILGIRSSELPEAVS